MPSDEPVDLRGQCPRDVADVLDAVSLARGLDRMQLVREILRNWARDQLHVATVLNRVTRSNPTESEVGGKGRA